MARWIKRSEWGARPPKRSYTGVADSEGIAVHHANSGMRPAANVDQAMAKMRSVQDFHMDSRGWNDYAYGFAVSAGCVLVGRGWGVIDGADTGAGRLMHSVCWLGDSDDYEVPPEDLAAFNEVIAEHGRRYPHSAARVVGHRDINATGCPGDRLWAWVHNGRPSIPDDITPEPEEASSMALVKATNEDGRQEFYRLDEAGRVIASWQGAPGGQFGPFVDIMRGQEFDDGPWAELAGGRIWVTAIDARFGQLVGTHQGEPGGAMVEPYVVNEFLAWIAANG